MRLAERLAELHGRVSLARENRGLHIYMASPICLARDGSVEVSKRHLALNAERYLGLGAWADKAGTYEPDNSALCMKTGTPYQVSELLSMPPLSARGITDNIDHRVTVGTIERHLVPDGKGNMIPEGPGETTSLVDLPSDHPAIAYLTHRNFEAADLVAQFDACFCDRELPVDPAAKRFYRKLPLGMCDTPQGRIVLYCDVGGIRLGWQARLIDREVVAEGHVIGREVLHPYTRQWVLTETFDQDRKRLMPVPDIARSELDWNPSKYRTARSALRNQLLMGVDAAVEWNQKHRPGRPPMAILVEGPLDAGRFGPPGVAMLGKSLSIEQAELMSRFFRQVILVPDNDLAGRQQTAKIGATLLGKVSCELAELPRGIKDAGEFPSREAAWEHIKPYIN